MTQSLIARPAPYAIWLALEWGRRPAAVQEVRPRGVARTQPMSRSSVSHLRHDFGGIVPSVAAAPVYTIATMRNCSDRWCHRPTHHLPAPNIRSQFLSLSLLVSRARGNIAMQLGRLRHIPRSDTRSHCRAPQLRGKHAPRPAISLRTVRSIWRECDSRKAPAMGLVSIGMAL